MKLNQDLGDLSPTGKAALLGTLALCCVVPMLVVFGAVSVAGALFGGAAVVVVGVVGLGAWAVWMGRYHHHMAEADHGHATAETMGTKGKDAPR